METVKEKNSIPKDWELFKKEVSKYFPKEITDSEEDSFFIKGNLFKEQWNNHYCFLYYNKEHVIYLSFFKSDSRAIEDIERDWSDCGIQFAIRKSDNLSTAATILKCIC